MWTQHTKFAAPTKAEMQKHPDCKTECQQSVAYGTWPEHSCNPKCVWLLGSAPPWEPEPDPMEGLRGMTADPASGMAIQQKPMSREQIEVECMLIWTSDYPMQADYDEAIVRVCERFHKIK